MRLVKIVLLHNIHAGTIDGPPKFYKGQEVEAYRLYNNYGDEVIRIDEGGIKGYLIISELEAEVYFVGVDDADEI